MEREKELSMTQLMVLAWLAAPAPAAELLPESAELGSAGGWLSPLLALPVVLVLGGVIGWAAEKNGLPQRLRRGLGPVLGRAVLFLYIGWAALLAGDRLGRCALRLSAGGSRDGSVWFFLGVMALTALWMSRGGAAALGRTAQTLLAVLLAAAGVVLLLALLRADWTLLVPPAGWARRSVLVGLAAGEALGPGLYAGFLLGRTDRERGGGTFLWWTVAGCLLLTAAQGVIQGCLGAALSAQLDSPFFTLAQSVGVEGAFQRVESIIITIWAAADLSFAVLLLTAMKELAAAVSERGSGRLIVGTGGAAAVITGVGAALGRPIGDAVRIGQERYVTLLLFLIPPVLAALFDKGRRTGNGGGTSCGAVKEKNQRYGGDGKTQKKSEKLEKNS